MSDTAIGWTDKVWNPVTGCSKVSEGCRNCYAEALSLRYGRSEKPWAAQYAAENVVLHPDRLTVPLTWKQPARCFVNSMSDLFHEQVPDELIDQIVAIMANTPQHTYQILTKRPERMARYFEHLTSQVTLFIDRTGGLPKVHEMERQRVDSGARCWPLPNVWLGTSVENQAVADERISYLMAAPAAIRFLSCEPLLGRVTLGQWIDGVYVNWLTGEYPDGDRTKRVADGLDWVIVGGESGPRHRPMDLPAALDIVDQCKAASVAVYVKQDSGQYPGRQGRIPDAYWLHEFPESRAAASVGVL